MTFEQLVAEGGAVPLEGWDFSWFAGRATEERPPWGYARLMGQRMSRATAALDIQTGGGEVLATVGPSAGAAGGDRVVAAQRRRGRGRLRALGGHLVAVADGPALPFASRSFDLVVSRHPVVVLWGEIARVLQPGGTYLAQQIGMGTNRELRDFMMGPQPVNQSRGDGDRPRRGGGRRARGARRGGERPARRVL